MDINNINTDRDTSGLGPIEYDQTKVPALIRKHADDVRTKTYGQDVREALARSSEVAGLTANEAIGMANETKTRQDTVENQFISMQQEITDKDVISAPEIIAARNGEATLNDRLDKEHQRVPSVANAKERLQIMNAYGNYENIHPKVLYFPNPWNGYKYWMAYTPYPNGDIKKENPSLAVSNSGINWTTPPLVTNPIEDWSGVANEYNNDTHLVFRSDLNRLEIWWRSANADTKVVQLKRKTTTTGTNWSSTEVMFTGTQDTDDHISPAVIFEDGKYKMLSVQSDLGWKVYYSESQDGKAWSDRQEVNINLTEGRLWHLDFIKSNSGYEMIATRYKAPNTTNTAHLVYLRSDDMINWTKPVKIIEPSPLENAFDNQGIYRSSIAKIDDVYYIYYSAVRKNNERGLSLAYGKSVSALVGFDYKMSSTDEVAFSNKVRIRNAAIKSHDTIDNLVEVVQPSNPERNGGLKIGNIVFGDGSISGVIPNNGNIRYNPERGVHQSFLGNTWGSIGSKLLLFLESNVAQTLTNGSFVDIDFPRVIFNTDSYGTKLFDVSETAYYKVSFGLQITGLVEGDKLEVQLQSETGSLVRLLYNQELPINNGNCFITSSTLASVSVGNKLKLAVKYTGTGTAKTTQYSSQNWLTLEKK